MHRRLPAPSRAIVVGVALAVAAAGCADSDGSASAAATGGDPGASAPASGAASSGGDPVPSAPTPGVPVAVLDSAREQAAAITGGDPAAVTVIRAEPVTWPNAGLGCPQPGMAYAEVLVPGYWVIVESEGRTLDFRGARKSGVLQLCENPPPG